MYKMLRSTANIALYLGIGTERIGSSGSRSASCVKLAPLLEERLASALADAFPCECCAKASQ